jgi:hypothetical protein
MRSLYSALYRRRSGFSSTSGLTGKLELTEMGLAVELTGGLVEGMTMSNSPHLRQ